MKKNLYSTLLVLLCSAGIALAQPGYQGRKLSVQGNFLFMPAVVNANYRKSPDVFTFNTTGQASIDYVLGKSNSIGLVYHTTRTSNLNNYGVKGVSQQKVFSSGLGVHYRIFRKEHGNIAPMGRYIQLGGGMIQSNVKQKDKELTDFGTYAMRFGAGRNKILFDRVILSYGWEFAYTFTKLDKEGLKGATFYYADDAQTMAQYRLFRQSMLNLKVGLGFLAL